MPPDQEPLRRHSPDHVIEACLRLAVKPGAKIAPRTAVLQMIERFTQEEIMRVAKTMTEDVQSVVKKLVGEEAFNATPPSPPAPDTRGL